AFSLHLTRSLYKLAGCYRFAKMATALPSAIPILHSLTVFALFCTSQGHNAIVFYGFRILRYNNRGALLLQTCHSFTPSGLSRRAATLPPICPLSIPPKRAKMNPHKRKDFLYDHW